MQIKEVKLFLEIICLEPEMLEPDWSISVGKVHPIPWLKEDTGLCRGVGSNPISDMMFSTACYMCRTVYVTNKRLNFDI